jgi:hypothetical protein
VNATANGLFPNRNSGMVFYFIGMNLRDQIRENETEPLQFQYLPANCRLYYTIANVYNLTQLWRDVANANWNDRSLCLPGSEGNSTGETEPPVRSNAPVLPPTINWPTNQPVPNTTNAGDGGMQDPRNTANLAIRLQECGGKESCSASAVSCEPIQVSCSATGQNQKLKYACVPTCQTKTDLCGSFECRGSGGLKVSTKVKSLSKTSHRGQPSSGNSTVLNYFGVCLPSAKGGFYQADPGKFGCPANES